MIYSTYTIGGELCHARYGERASHKYIDKLRTKSGKWRYIYKNYDTGKKLGLINDKADITAYKNKIKKIYDDLESTIGRDYNFTDADFKKEFKKRVKKEFPNLSDSEIMDLYREVYTDSLDLKNLNDKIKEKRQGKAVTFAKRNIADNYWRLYWRLKDMSNGR